MVLAFASLVVIAYLPGAVIFRLPAGDRARRSALGAGERLFWAVMLSVAISTLGAVALGAAGAYSLGHLVAVNLGIGAVAAVLARGRLRYDSAAPRPGWTLVAPCALVALGLWLYFPSSEYVIGGKDPGTYMNQGVRIAQSGSLRIADATLAAVPGEFRDLFLTGDAFEIAEGLNQGVRFMGFFVTDRSRGEVGGQFPHAFPAWIAIGYGLNGLSGARQAVGAWAILGLLAVYFAAARLVGRLAALAGCALLAVNVAEVWYARYPNSEVMQQALVFAAFLALARDAHGRIRFFGPVAAALFGLALFTRIDTIVILGAAFGGLLLLALDGKRPGWSFFAALAACVGVVFPYWDVFLRSYASTPLGIVRSSPALLYALAAVLAALAAVRFVHVRHPDFLARVRRWLPPGLAVVLAAGAVYGGFFREPSEHVRDYAAMRTVKVGLSVQDAWSLRMYGWYVGASGIVAALAGFALLSRRRFWRDPALLTAAAALAVFVFYKVRIVPEHFWQVRRYLAVILPMTCVLAAWAALAPFQRWRRSRGTALTGRAWATHAAPYVLLPLLLLGYLGWQYTTATRAILDHVEYRGIIAQIESLSARFTDRDLVVFEPRNSSDAHVLATPLAYIYGRNVLLLSTPRPDRARFEQFLAWAGGAYERVWLVAEGGVDIASPVVSARPVLNQSFAVPEYESALNAYPREIRQKKFGLNLYQLSRTDRAQPVTDVDVGGFDDLWVLRVFAREHGDGASYRWIRDMSYVAFQGVGPDARAVVLRMSNGGRPAMAGEARVSMFLNDEALGEVVVGTGFQEYRVPVPPAVALRASQRSDVSVLRLMSTTWSPNAVIGGTDDRQLGVMLDRARVE